MHVSWEEQWRGSKMKLTFLITGTDFGSQLLTDPIDVGRLAAVRFKFNVNKRENGSLQPSISYKKSNYQIDIVKINVSCAEFENESICADDWTEFIDMDTVTLPDWNSVFNLFSFVLKVNITVQDVTSKSLVVYNKLYEDTEFTDFHLKAEDGAVGVHKAVLGTQSDVFLKMFNGEWKETTDGHVSISGVTLQTLQDLKDYLYLRRLPDDQQQLQQLLLTAGCYLMDDLKADCILKLVESVTPENFDALVQFACENNMPALMKAVVIHTPDDIVNSVNELSITDCVSVWSRE